MPQIKGSSEWEKQIDVVVAQGIIKTESKHLGLKAWVL